MSAHDWRAEMEGAIVRVRANRDDATLEIINARLDESGLRAKVWGFMNYGCDKCGRRERYEMEVGVEGPPEWRDDLCYLASAFTAGHCEECGGAMTHVDWGSDGTYTEPRDPTALRVWRVPRAWPTHVTRGMYADGTIVTTKACSAFLALNVGALR